MRSELPRDHNGVLGDFAAAIDALKRVEGEEVNVLVGQLEIDGPEVLRLAGEIRHEGSGPDGEERFKVGDAGLLRLIEARFEGGRLVTFDDNDFFQITIVQAGVSVLVADQGSTVGPRE